MVDVCKREDRLLDYISQQKAAKIAETKSVLRTIELWREAEPGMSLVLDDIASQVRQSLYNPDMAHDHAGQEG